MTPEERLRLIRVKVKRAKKHLCDLEVERDAFIDSDPYKVGIKSEPQATIYYLNGVRATPAVIPAIAGDILFNLRAALDHLACMLVEVNCVNVTFNTGYPIINTLDLAVYKTSSSGKVEGMTQRAIDAIDATEPYQGGKGHVLWQLHRLNIRDKHHMLITAGCGLATIRMHPTKRSQMHKAIHAEVGVTISDAQAVARLPVGEKRIDFPCPLEEGNVLYRDLFANEEVNPNNHFTFDVALNEPPIVECKPLLPTLVGMADRVDDLITSFKPWLA